MNTETIKECLDMSVNAVVKAVNHLERMKDANLERQDEIQERIGALCRVMETLMNEKGEIGRLQ